MVCQIWSCEAICPSIPKFHLAKPTQFLPHPSAPKPSKNKNNNNTTSWQDEHKSVSMSAASSLKPNLFFTSFFERSKTDFEENIMAGLFLFFFSLLNMAVELVVGMWCQFNSESCFSFSWKPHRKFFEKLQTFFTVKPGDRENLFTPFTGKSCCVQLKQV